jgi:glycosyltransferase involved in cell wall biosynthesis
MRVVLIGNYNPDQQQSMLRYADMLLEVLEDADHDVRLIAPQPVLNYPRRDAHGIWKWIGYADKYLVATPVLSRAVRDADIVHICDHSNAVYVPRSSDVPYVVSCHDLLAVRGALGEDTDCPPGMFGRQLQHAILSGLKRAHALACVSQATLRDARRLLGTYSGHLIHAPNALNYPYRRLSSAESRERLERFPSLTNGVYVLHVGSNLRRKNREVALRAVATIAREWPGKIVFAGHALDGALRTLASEFGIADRIVDVSNPSNELLEALYNRALGLLFPSRFEGFGWPIVEAQACGCPVICSDREPLPEVAGGAAIICDANDAAAFGQAILQLMQGDQYRDGLARRGEENAAHYSRARLGERLASLYAQVARTG